MAQYPNQWNNFNNGLPQRPVGFNQPPFSQPPPIVQNYGFRGRGHHVGKPMPGGLNNFTRPNFQQNVGSRPFLASRDWGNFNSYNNQQNQSYFNPSGYQRQPFTPDTLFSDTQNPPAFQQNYNFRGRGGPRGRSAGFSNNRGRGGHWQRNEQNQKKKQKIDKRDLPENNAYFCDVCDRGFKTEEKYQEHVDSHEKCRYKDCPFVAAPKLVQLHVNMQHRRGLAQKIYQVETKEDIDKWREERKRNFPTRSNIEKKKQELEDKVSRGQVIENKSFSKMKNKGKQFENRLNSNKNEKWKQRNEKQNEWTHKSIFLTATTEEKLEDEKINEMLLKQIEDVENEDSDDDDDQAPTEMKIKRSNTNETDSVNDEEQDPNPEIIKSKTTSGLGLLGAYGEISSDDSELDEVDVKNDPLSAVLLSNKSFKTNSNSSSNSIKTSKTDKKQEMLNSKEKILNMNEESLSAAVSDQPNPEAEVVAKKTKFEKRRGKRKMNNQSVNPKRKMHTSRFQDYTLLERLLAPDIRKERNKILQCVHFIVKNKFFE